MKTKEIFSLAVRLLGLMFLYHGLMAMPTVFSVVTSSIPGGEFRNTLVALFMGAWPLFAAYWLLRGAPLVMATAYPQTPPDKKTDTQIGGAFGHKS